MVRPKKHLGQHFLKDISIAEKIADSIIHKNLPIVEVGPGTGALTQCLIQKSKSILAFEVDKESITYLQHNFPKDNLTVYNQNFLTTTLSSYLKDQYVVTGNFPYNISSQIIFKVLENKTQIPEMVGMFQKEVAERICASHGNKTYGVISVLTQAYYKTEYLFSVDNVAFYPPPKVQSGVIRLIRYRNDLESLEPLFTQLVKTAFQQRRKKISNALKSMQIPTALTNHKFLNLRAEQLSVEDFIELTTLWHEYKH